MTTHEYALAGDAGTCRVCGRFRCDYADLEDRIDRRARTLGLTRRAFLATEEGHRALATPTAKIL